MAFQTSPFYLETDPEICVPTPLTKQHHLSLHHSGFADSAQSGSSVPLKSSEKGPGKWHPGEEVLYMAPLEKIFDMKRHPSLSCMKHVSPKVLRLIWFVISIWTKMHSHYRWVFNQCSNKIFCLNIRCPTGFRTVLGSHSAGNFSGESVVSSLPVKMPLQCMLNPCKFSIFSILESKWIEYPGPSIPYSSPKLKWHHHPSCTVEVHPELTPLFKNKNHIVWGATDRDLAFKWIIQSPGSCDLHPNP